MNGWLVKDNILLRPRQADLYEITAAQADGVELAYLLAAPTSGSGDLEMVVGLDTTLEAYAASEGIFLLDRDGNELRIGTATAIDANGASIAVSVEPDAEGIRLVVPGDWLACGIPALHRVGPPRIGPRNGIGAGRLVMGRAWYRGSYRDLKHERYERTKNTKGINVWHGSMPLRAIRLFAQPRSSCGIAISSEER